MSFLWMLIVGGIIGWLAGLIMGRDIPGGVIGNIIAGIIGSWLGGVLLGSWGPKVSDFYFPFFDRGHCSDLYRQPYSSLNKWTQPFIS